MIPATNGCRELVLVSYVVQPVAKEVCMNMPNVNAEAVKETSKKGLNWVVCNRNSILAGLAAVFSFLTLRTVRRLGK